MQEYADKILRLTVRLEQLSKGASKDTQNIIRMLQKEMLGKIGTANINTKAQLALVQKQVKALSQKRYKEIAKTLEDSSETAAKAALIAEETAYASLGIAAAGFAKALPVDNIIKKALERVMPGLGGRQISVGDMIERFLTIGSSDLKNITTRAFNEGLSVSKIAKMIQESTGAQLNASESVARTAIQSASNQARDDIADEYGADKEMWSATLDASTCQFCQGLDGQCKEKGELPDAPAHPRCRCVKLYIPDDMTCAQMKKDLTRVERGPDGKSRPTDKYQDYGTWIKTQPKDFQEEVLGIQRTKLLNDGTITFKKMYTQSGSIKTIDDIKKHYS